MNSVDDLIRRIHDVLPSRSLLGFEWDDHHDIPLPGLWNEAIEYAVALPHEDLAKLPEQIRPLVLDVPKNIPISPYFYVFVSAIIDVAEVNQVLSLTDLTGKELVPQQSGQALQPGAFAYLLPRMLDDIAHRAQRWASPSFVFADNDEIDPDLVMTTLAFCLARGAQLDATTLAAIDQPKIQSLFAALNATSLGSLDVANDSIMRLMLALNDQFMSIQGMEDNAVIRCLESAVPGSQRFTEGLIFILNRAPDVATQIMVLKMIFLILNGHSDLFFTNDLRVLTDVIVREVNNLEAYQTKLRNAFMRVLDVLYPHVHPHKAADVALLLHHVMQPAEDSPVDPETMRVATRLQERITTLSSA